MLSEYTLPRSAPEEQGIASSAILAFLDAVEKEGLELHGLMLLRHGYVTAEGWWAPYGPGHPHMLFSLTKSFTSTAVGFAVSEGLLNIEDPVISFFTEQVTEPVNAQLASMRVKDLLTMSAGHASPIMGAEWRQTQGDWVSYFLNKTMDHPPGTKFMYNSGASYMLSAIVQKVSGQTLLNYLRPRLFKPLGIHASAWDTCPSGNNTGGWGLSLKTEDLARFGQFYLQKGMWNGKQLLPESWIEAATSYQISSGSDKPSDSQQGYGYQFWRSRHNTYRADGKFGQFCVVMPEQDAVIAIHGGLENMQAVLNLIWKHLLPAMEDHSLEENKQFYSLLQTRLRRLTMLPPKLQASSPIAEQVSGKYFVPEEHDDQIKGIKFTFGEDGCTFALEDHRGEHRIQCGINTWLMGDTTMSGRSLHHQYEPPVMRVAANGTWHDDHTYVMTWCFVETPFIDTVVCRFNENKLRLERSVNVNSEAKHRPPVLAAWT